MTKKLFIITTLFLCVFYISGCSRNIQDTNLDNSFNYSIENLGKEEYFNVNPSSNGISFEANFHSDTCRHDYTYSRNGNHLRIIQNLQLETCADIYTYSGVRGEVTNLPKGNYKITMYFRYDKSLYGENTDQLELFTKDFEIN